MLLPPLLIIIFILYRQPGQGGAADAQLETRDLRAELLRAEAAHFAKIKGGNDGPGSSNIDTESSVPKRQLESAPGQGENTEEDPEAKRRRILEETRDIDADSDGRDSDSSEDDRYVRNSALSFPKMSADLYP